MQPLSPSLRCDGGGKGGCVASGSGNRGLVGLELHTTVGNAQAMLAPSVYDVMAAKG